MAGENTARDYSSELEAARINANQMPKTEAMRPGDFSVPQSGKADNYDKAEENEKEEGSADGRDNHVDRLAEARNKGQEIKDTMNMAKNMAKTATPMGAFSLLMNASLLKDIPYVAALGAAILKDGLDLVFVGSLPGVGTVITILCSIFIAMMMMLSGSGKKRAQVSGVFKRIGALLAGTAIEIVLPGLNFFPIETATVLVIYAMTLMERQAAQE